MLTFPVHANGGRRSYNAAFAGDAMRFGLILILSLCLVACGNAGSDAVMRISGPTMGTTYNIAWMSVPPVSADTLKNQVDERLRDINRNMSTYDPDSELSKLNQGRLIADEQGWIGITPDLAEVISMSLDIWRSSHGAFDVTVGPLVNLWGFGPDARPEQIPSSEDIELIRQRIGSDAIELDGSVPRIRLHKPLYIDLSAIAKGWAVDELADLLEKQGIQNYMIEVGGEIRTRGNKPDGNLWRIAIERPQMELTGREAALIIAPGNMGMATSGDYRNYFEQHGIRYSHTIDPSTGFPITHTLASVTVVHESSGYADGWATALNVLGPESGLALAEQKNLAVMMLVRSDDGFIQQTTSRFNELFPHSAD